jgi:hypothetical protein
VGVPFCSLAALPSSFSWSTLSSSNEAATNSSRHSPAPPDSSSLPLALCSQSDFSIFYWIIFESCLALITTAGHFESPVVILWLLVKDAYFFLNYLLHDHNLEISVHAATLGHGPIPHHVQLVESLQPCPIDSRALEQKKFDLFFKYSKGIFL